MHVSPPQTVLTPAAGSSVEEITAEVQAVEREVPPIPRLDKGKGRAVEPLSDSPTRTPAMSLPDPEVDDTQGIGGIVDEEQMAYNRDPKTWEVFEAPGEDSPPKPVDFSKPGPSNQFGTNQRLHNVPAVEVRGIARCTTIPCVICSWWSTWASMKSDITRSTSRRINRDEGSAKPSLDSDVEIRFVAEPATHDSPRDCVDESMDSAVAEQLHTPSPVEAVHVYVPFCGHYLCH